ncbi:MAG: ABC transporter permease [Oceanobacter sp.]
MMNVQPLVLGSDALIFLLVATLIAFGVKLARDPLARAKWHKVFRTPVGMASFLVILFYVLIALLDSIHFREALVEEAGESVAQESEQTHYSHEVKSLLDLILVDLSSRDEKTYSEPFATESFAKENKTLDDGTVIRDYPPLQYGGQHLEAGESVLSDVLSHSLSAFWVALAIMAAFVALHWQWRHRCTANGCQMPSTLPWKTCYITLGCLLFISLWILELGQFYHILGTDQVGRDVLYLAIKAVRTGVLIGTLATLLTLPIAILLGISAGYFRGWVDDLVQYVYTTLSSIPGILLIAASVLLIDVYIETHPEQFTLTTERADFRFLALCFILGMTSWTGLCRLLRAETLKVSQLEYVQAARAFGVGPWRIIGKHILPNVTHIVLIALVLDFSGFVLAEAVLSYIGVGVDPSMASWGNMINEARAELSREPVVWWTVAAAFLMMFGLVLAANLFADRVRDAFDPRSH